MFIKIAMLVVFFAVLLAIGFYCRKKATDVNGFVLGGRNVGPWLTAFSYGTSYFSAVIFVGYAGQFGWKYGIASTWIGIGNALLGALLAWVILGRRTRVMSQHLKSSTMSDFFGIRYKSEKLKIASSVIIFVFLIPYTASLYNGLSRLFESAFGVPYIYCVGAMALFTAVYVILGGYMAAAINDFLQGLIMLGGIIAVIAAVLMQKGGFTAAVEQLSQINEGNFNGAYTSFLGPQPLSLLFVVLLTSLGTWGLPQMVQKFYAIKNEKSVKKGAIISTLFAIVVAGGCYFLGGFGRLFSDVIEYQADGVTPVYDSIVPSMIENLPDVLVGIVIVLVLSASITTLSALVLTSSSTLTLGLIKPLRKKKYGEKSQLLTMRVLIAFFIVVSAAIAIIQATSKITFIAQLMGISWGALAGAFLAPFLYGLYSKRVTRAAVWVSFILGAGIMLANMICSWTVDGFSSLFIGNPINAGVVAMLINLVAVPVISMMTPKMDSAAVDEMFSCYNKIVSVSSKDALGESGADKH